MKYQNYVFDLYGTLVDIHTDEEQQMLWEKMAMFYGYQGAFYTPAELHDAFYDMVHDLEDMQKSEMLKRENTRMRRSRRYRSKMCF